MLAVGITILGVALLSLNGNHCLVPKLGDSLLLLAAFGYTMNSIAVVKLGKDASSIQITSLQLFVTMIVTGIMTLIQGNGENYPVSAAGAQLYLAIGPTLICFLIKNDVLKYITPICSIGSAERR